MTENNTLKCLECENDIELDTKNLKSLICPYCGNLIEIKQIGNSNKNINAPNLRRGCCG